MNVASIKEQALLGPGVSTPITDLEEEIQLFNLQSVSNTEWAAAFFWLVTKLLLITGIFLREILNTSPPTAQN